MRRILLAAVMGLVLSGCIAVPPGPLEQSPTMGAELATSMATAAGEPGPGTVAPITLAMGYIPSVQFAPFYVAQSRGYFADAGLDITFRYGFESDLLKLVGTNELQYMIGSGEQVILGRSQGLPVRYVMRWYRRFPVVLFAKTTAGIETPADLAGKRVGLPGLFGASYVGWEAIVYATGLDPASVTLQSIGFTQATAISQDQVDAALDYVVNGPVQLRLAGEDVIVFPVSDFVDLPSNGLITNDQTIQAHPDQVQALVTAVLRGLVDTLADPDAAFDICLGTVPEVGGDQAAISRAIFDESLRLWQAEEGQLGLSDPTAWSEAAAFMQQMGLIQQAVNPEDLYTNEFVAR